MDGYVIICEDLCAKSLENVLPAFTLVWLT